MDHAGVREVPSNVADLLSGIVGCRFFDRHSVHLDNGITLAGIARQQGQIPF
jgi:hypothetical protein